MYKSSTLIPHERARDLLSQMTVDEKIDQMIHFSSLVMLRNSFLNGEEMQSRAGAFGNFKIFEDDEINQIQDYFLKETRLGIPLLMAWESLHGFWHPNGTAFPQTLGLACSFNPELIEKMADVIGKEARAVGVRQVFAPDVDIPRDPRWGRMQETYGEDPYLSGEMGAAYVRGVQKNGVASTVKHYTGYGVPEGGINLATAHLGEREIREVMLEPFKKCIEAGAMAVMPSYNDIDGIPVHANKKLLRGILRDELGFNGITISDWDAVRQFRMFHFTAKDDLTAGEMALNAGVDIEAPTPVGYGEDFRNAVKNDEIDMALIDEAVLRVLTLKFELGLFENPYNNHELLAQMHSKEAVELARKLDEQSILLLKNDGILPLTPEKTWEKNVYAESFHKDPRVAELLTKDLREMLTEVNLVDNPRDADIAILMLHPSSGEYFNATKGYLELDICEGKVVHDVDDKCRPVEATHEEVTLTGAKRIAEIADTVHANEGKVIMNVNFTLAWMLGNVEPYADALTGGYDTYPSAVLEVIRGQFSPVGKLPFTLPRGDEVLAVNADGVCISPNDVPGYDKDKYMPDELKDENGKAYAYRDAHGNYYELDFGLRW